MRGASTHGGPSSRPPRLRGPKGASATLPRLGDLVAGKPSPELPAGGEAAGRKRLQAWLADGLEHYEERAGDLGAEATSRLSPYLHFGCVSPLEVAERAAGSEAFVRQLCWRDFHHQLLAANPELPREDLLQALPCTSLRGSSSRRVRPRP